MSHKDQEAAVWVDSLERRNKTDKETRFNRWTLLLEDPKLEKAFTEETMFFIRNCLVVFLYVSSKITPGIVWLLVHGLQPDQIVHGWLQIGKGLVTAVIVYPVMFVVRKKSRLIQTLTIFPIVIFVASFDVFEDRILESAYLFYYYIDFLVAFGFAILLCFASSMPWITVYAIIQFIVISSGDFFTVGSPYLLILEVFWPLIIAGSNNYYLELFAIKAFLKKIDALSQQEELEKTFISIKQFLRNLFPKSVAAKLAQDEDAASFFKMYDCSVLFIRLEIMLPISEKMKVASDCFRTMDQIIKSYGTGVEKIKSTGFRYVISIGLPDPVAQHSNTALKLAFDIQQDLLSLEEPALNFFIGVNSGPVVAGIVGTLTQGFDIWGDTVNVSSRMCSLCSPNSVLCSKSTVENVTSKISSECRTCFVKGRGDMEVYTVKPAEEEHEQEEEKCIELDRTIIPTTKSPDSFLSPTPIPKAEASQFSQEKSFSHWLASSGAVGVTFMTAYIFTFWINDFVTLDQWLRLLCIPIILGCYILCARSRTTTLYGVVSVSSVCAATFATSIVASYTGSSVSKCVSVMVQYSYVFVLGMVIYRIEFVVGIVLGVIHIIVGIAGCWIIEFDRQDSYIIQVLCGAAVGLFACHTAQSNFLKLSNETEALERTKQVTTRSICKMKRLADSVIPPQLSSAILGEAVQKLLSESDSLLQSSFITSVGGCLFNIYTGVSVICADIVDFTKTCSALGPVQTIELLNETFNLLDSIAANYGLIKIKTIGDAVIYVAGMDSLDWKQRTLHNQVKECEIENMASCESAIRNATRAVNCSCEIVDHLCSSSQRHYNALVRIGCSTGTILGGIASRYKFTFDVYGTPVDAAEHLSGINSALSISFDEETVNVAKEPIDQFLLTHPAYKITKSTSTRNDAVQYTTITM